MCTEEGAVGDAGGEQGVEDDAQRKEHLLLESIIIMALYSYGPIQLWPYILMALRMMHSAKNAYY